MLAGLAKSLSLDTSSSREFKKSSHGIFVHTHVLPLTLKLQKEIRGRKYKVGCESRRGAGVKV